MKMSVSMDARGISEMGGASTNLEGRCPAPDGVADDNLRVVVLVDSQQTN
jgi:hypothetical protein